MYSSIPGRLREHEHARHDPSHPAAACTRFNVAFRRGVTATCFAFLRAAISCRSCSQMSGSSAATRLGRLAPSLAFRVRHMHGGTL